MSTNTLGYRPFEVLWDKTNKRWYVRPPKHLAAEVSGEQLSHKVKAVMAAKSLRFKVRFAGRLERPPRRLTKPPLASGDGSPAATNAAGTVVATMTLAQVHYEECLALGYDKSLDAIIEEKRDVLRALKTEQTLEEIREDFARWLEHADQKCPKQAKLVRQLDLPWRLKRLGEFITREKRLAAILEAEQFLSSGYNFITGDPWSAATRVGWVGRFCLIVDHGIHRALTDLPSNFFRKALSRPDLDVAPVILPMDRLQEFMTFVFYWHVELYVGLVLATWGCIRVEEVDKVLGEMIDLIKGTIELPDSITKMGDERTILEADVPNLFALLRAVSHLIPKKGLVMKNKNWKNHLYYAYRELFGEPWPGNVLRSTGASATLVLTDMPTCGRVIGHRFEGIDEILLKYYRKHMQPEAANTFKNMKPEPWSPELEAKYKYRLYRAVSDVTLSSNMWPNFAVKGQHTVGMNSAGMTALLRKKRPIFAEAKGRNIEIETINLDGTKPPLSVVRCPSRRTARKMVHRIKVALLTGQGVIDVQTGHVAHYERNYGPCLGQRLFRLTNGPELRKQMENRRMNVRDVAREVNTSIDVLCRYFSMGTPKNRVRHLPESHKLKLESMFSGLLFEHVPPPSDVMAWICSGAPSTSQSL
jgi:hypothetical protein